MATAVEDGPPLPLPKDASNLTSQRQPAIRLLLSVEGDSHVTRRNIQVFAGETIRDLKIQLRKKEFFTSKHCLVFGQRELLENETVGQVLHKHTFSHDSLEQLITQSNGEDLHIVAKLSDLEELEVITDKQKRVLKNERLPLGGLSALRLHSNPCSLLLCGRIMEQGKELDTPILSTADPVVHLVVRRSSKVHWHLKGEQFQLRISDDATVEEVKKKLEEVAVGFEPSEHALMKDGQTLQPDMSLTELGVRKGDILEIKEVPLCLEEFPEPGSPKNNPKTAMPIEWERARHALAHGVRPKLTSVGTGGSYFISAKEGMNLAVFKPEDEEPQAPNNPKGHRGSPTGEGLRKGVRPGEGATREVIAFTLDHKHFSGVPPTTMASLSDCRSARHRKVGSFQQFVEHDVDCEEIGPSDFPVKEVHKICVLDIRLGNTDRNAGNILARRVKGEWVLTPIDHGYCLPDSFEDINFEWMYWPQAKVPFDAETRAYIAELDVDRDIELLTKAGLSLRQPCIRVFRVCMMLLKAALSHGLTPHQIGQIMCRQSFAMSPLEKLHKGAVALTLGRMYGNIPAERRELDEGLYLRNMGDVIDQYLEETHDNVTIT